MNNVPTRRKRIVSTSVLLEHIKVGLLGEKIDGSPQKRIVSKAEFIGIQARQAKRCVYATFLLIVGLLCIFLAGLSIFGLLRSDNLCLVLIIIFGMGAYSFLMQSIDVLRQWESVEVVPLTRASLADLPIPDSLVRASQEPPGAQEAVLMRPASAWQNEHTEQLLKAVNEQH